MYDVAFALNQGIVVGLLAAMNSVVSIHAKYEPMTPTRRVSRYMQYARMFLQDIFPDVTKVLYLDADVVVLGDVIKRQLFWPVRVNYFGRFLSSAKARCLAVC